MAAHSYLIDAKEQVDKAVAAYEAGVRPEAEIDKMLRDASTAGCEALRQLHNDEEQWQPRRRERKTFLAVLGIVRDKEHFEARCFPMTVEALRAFGFKPPEKAEELVGTARRACDSLNSGDNPDALAADAREAVKRLANATCEMAQRLAKKARSQETRKKWRGRGAKVLFWVSATLGAALIQQAVKSDYFRDHLSDAGKAAIETVGMRGVQDAATKGVEQAEENAQEAKQDREKGDGQPARRAPRPPG